MKHLEITQQINYIDYEQSLNIKSKIKLKEKILKRYIFKIHYTYDKFITD